MSECKMSLSSLHNVWCKCKLHSTYPRIFVFRCSVFPVSNPFHWSKSVHANIDNMIITRKARVRNETVACHLFASVRSALPFSLRILCQPPVATPTNPEGDFLCHPYKATCGRKREGKSSVSFMHTVQLNCEVRSWFMMFY